MGLLQARVLEWVARPSSRVAVSSLAIVIIIVITDVLPLTGFMFLFSSYHVRSVTSEVSDSAT